MPRSGVNGTYTLPGAQKTQQPLTPIPSAVNNQGWEDVEQTFNTIQPIAYGGTGGGTILDAQQNLGITDKLNDDGSNATDDAFWAMKPLAEVFYVWDHLAGFVPPPTDKSFRYIKLTASDAYNTGVLTGETVSGSGALVVATAVIDLDGSPFDGATISLINTERRVLRAGSSGVVQNDAMQRITGGFRGGRGGIGTGAFTASSAPALVANGASEQTDVTFDSGNAAGVRVSDTETRAKNIGATAYMRIK